MTGFLPILAWLLSPLLLGVINRTKAKFAGRQGSPLFQAYYDIVKLLYKGTVYSRTTTWIVRIVPFISLSCLVLASLMIPWGTVSSIVNFPGDMIVVIYLLGLARFATVLAALDTGSSFEGMGASREVQFAALVEPSIFLGMLVLVIQTGQISLSDIFGSLVLGEHLGFAPLLLVACSWLVALLTENSRIPVDDPNTHLELTMIHEVMVLDYSGPDLAAILYSASLKLWIFGALLVNLLLPFHSGDEFIQVLLFIAGMFFIAVLIGIVESIMARFSLRQIPRILLGSCALGSFALILQFLGGKV